MAYSEKVIDHGELKTLAAWIKVMPMSEREWWALCVATSQVQLRINDDGIIEDAKLKTFVAPPSHRVRWSPQWSCDIEGRANQEPALPPNSLCLR